MSTHEGRPPQGSPFLVLGVCSISLTRSTPPTSFCVAYDLYEQKQKASAKAGRILWSPPHIEEAKGNLWSCIDACLATCSATYADVAAICVGASCRHAAVELEDLAASLRERFSQNCLQVVQRDAVLALAAGTGGLMNGVVVVADEHAVSYGARGPGEGRFASGWGPLFMEGGSAYDLGQRALLAVTKAWDGRGAATRLSETVLAHVEMTDVEDLIKWGYEGPSLDKVCLLADVVVAAAERTDAVAETILRHGVGELLRDVTTVATHLGIGGTYARSGTQPPKLVLAGRMLCPGSIYAQYLSQVLQDQLPGMEIVHLTREPAEAAAFVALSQLARRARPQSAAPPTTPVGDRHGGGGGDGGGDGGAGGAPGASGSIDERLGSGGASTSMLGVVLPAKRRFSGASSD